MVKVDKKVCIKACPFSDKGNEGICLLAMHHQRPREEVCQSTVPISVEHKKE